MTDDAETVNALRRTMMIASTAHQKLADTYSTKWLEVPRDVQLSEEGHAIGAAMHGQLMAASYAYTLAAALRMVSDTHGEKAAADLARELDEIMTNGDFDDVNGDLDAETSA